MGNQALERSSYFARFLSSKWGQLIDDSITSSSLSLPFRDAFLSRTRQPPDSHHIRGVAFLFWRRVCFRLISCLSARPMVVTTTKPYLRMGQRSPISPPLSIRSILESNPLTSSPTILLYNNYNAVHPHLCNPLGLRSVA